MVSQYDLKLGSCKIPNVLISQNFVRQKVQNIFQCDTLDSTTILPIIEREQFNLHFFDTNFP
jgi:hypothetical protein